MSALNSSKDEHPLRHSISGLLQSGLYSDATIVCDDQTFHVHKAVICTQSAYFARAFDKDNGFKEACTNVIELQDVSSAVVRSMLEFMYHCDYTKCEDPNEDLIANIYIYNAAEMFQLKELKEAAAQRFKAGADTMSGLPMLRAAIESIYEGTVEQDRCLRDVVVEIAVRKMDKLVKDSDFNGILERVPTFSKDLVHGLHSKLKEKSGTASKRTIRCPGPFCRRERAFDAETYQNDSFWDY
ncbi:BTB/POZ protein [Phyllosticta capitalensis]